MLFIFLFLLLAIQPIYANNLIPAVKSGFYYEIGGGNDVPLPAFYSTSTIPLNVHSNVGLGFDCGAFNPVASITNSLNEIKSSALHVERQVLNNATSAVTEFPLYELSRSDPNLYNLITNAIAGAQENIRVSTKSCEVMQSEIAAGQDPYAHWGQIALGNRWQQAIGSAELSGTGDINQARYNIAHSAGKKGIPWVNPNGFYGNNSSRSYYAGGQNQPAIHIVYDTVMAGYHVILNDHRSNLSSYGLHQMQSELTRIFATDKQAANWVIRAVGDEIMTTYDGGKKSSQPGVGLYSDIQRQMRQLVPKLSGLVVGAVALTVSHLQAISSYGMALSPQIIRSIQHQPKVVQKIIINKLAQNIAAMRVINKARLAIRILQSGSRVPVIYANKAAQKNIQHAVNLLRQDTENILLFIKARQTLMTGMLSTIVRVGESQKINNTSIASLEDNSETLQSGAISK